METDYDEIMECLNDYSDEVRVTEVSIIRFYGDFAPGMANLTVRLQSDHHTFIHNWVCELQQAKDIAFKLI